MLYTRHGRGLGPLADDPRHPTPYSPATRFSVALNAVGENVLTVYGICILHAAAVGKTFISYNIICSRFIRDSTVSDCITMYIIIRVTREIVTSV